MTQSLKSFASITKLKTLESTPIIVLLTKFDLLEENMRAISIYDYFPSYCGSLDPSLACRYFASEFLKLDERPNASLRIYRISAVDKDSFKEIMDGIAKWISREDLDEYHDHP